MLYHEYMTRVYLADAKLEERSVLRLLLLREQSVLRAVDAALYHAKHEGRSRVVVAD